MSKIFNCFKQQRTLFSFFWSNFCNLLAEQIIIQILFQSVCTKPVRNKHDGEYHDDIEKKTTTEPGNNTMQRAGEYGVFLFHFKPLFESIE